MYLAVRGRLSSFSVIIYEDVIVIKMDRGKDEPFRPVAPEHTVLASRIVIDGTSEPEFCADVRR